MVTRARLLLAVLVAPFLACTQPAPSQADEVLVLRGFKLVDPASRSVTERELVVSGGVVVAQASTARARVIEGRGRFLTPALWDMKAALWGNNSTKSYEELTQDMSFSRALAVQLYYGVAHVGIFGSKRVWTERVLKRGDALELLDAEPLYPDVMLCGRDEYGCVAVPDAAALEAALDDRRQHRVPFVTLAARAAKPGKEDVGLRPELLAAALQGARARRLPTVVTIHDWQRAAEVVELGASAIYGLPAGDVPDELIAQLRERDVAYAPALALYLELDHLLGNERELSDPFLTATVRPAVLASYRSDRDMFPLWREFLEQGRARKHQALRSLERLAKAGVRVLVASDSCWAATFQGHASHATQAWLERAGLDGWTRLSAGTLWPAQLLGRHVGFEPGQPADFLALDADPLESAQNLRRISLIIRKGRLVDRSRLLPDLTRSEFGR